MSKAALILAGIGTLGILGLAVATHKATSAPKTALDVAGIPGLKPADYYSHMASQVGFTGGLVVNPPAQARSESEAIMGAFKDRWWAANKVASDLSSAPDKYSKQKFLVFRQRHGASGKEPWGWFWTDEFGRPFEGWGAPGSGTFDAVGFVKSLSPALYFVPGIGPAGNAAIQGAIAAAEGKSVQDIGLAAAQAALPPGTWAAFDLGLGIASGESVNQATVDAALEYLDKKYPGSKKAYKQARER